MKTNNLEHKFGQAITYQIAGIKCDHPGCTWQDENVASIDYSLWLNRPCPNCESSLLTEKDLIVINRIIKFTKFLNVMFYPITALTDLFRCTKDKTFSLSMNGTGSVEIKEKD